MESKTKTKRICTYCNRTLVAIGRDRKNGKQSHNDWSTRTMHKHCYYEQKMSITIKEIIDSYRDGAEKEKLNLTKTRSESFG